MFSVCLVVLYLCFILVHIGFSCVYFEFTLLSNTSVVNSKWFLINISWTHTKHPQHMLAPTGLTHAKLVSLTSPCCSGWPAPMNIPQGQQRTAEQRWVRWLQCLIRKRCCVNHQFQFHTQIAYKPTYMTHGLCYLLLFNYWHWHKI